jgi:hypothetical protein
VQGLVKEKEMAKKTAEETVTVVTSDLRPASEVAAEYIALGKKIDELSAARDLLRGQLIEFIKSTATQAVVEEGKSMKKVLSNGIKIALTFSEKRAVIESVLAQLPDTIRVQLLSSDLTKIKKFYKNDTESLDKIAPVSVITETLKVTE